MKNYTYKFFLHKVSHIYYMAKFFHMRNFSLLRFTPKISTFWYLADNYFFSFLTFQIVNFLIQLIPARGFGKIASLRNATKYTRLWKHNGGKKFFNSDAKNIVGCQKYSCLLSKYPYPISITIIKIESGFYRS